MIELVEVHEKSLDEIILDKMANSITNAWGILCGIRKPETLVNYENLRTYTD